MNKQRADFPVGENACQGKRGTPRGRLVELLEDAIGEDWRTMCEAIADYLLANGVIVPPCKIGQTVYWYDSAIHSKPYPMIVTGIADYGEGHMWVYCKNGIDHRQFRASSFGKTVFLTKEEAEQALNNVQNGNSCEGGAEE